MEIEGRGGGKREILNQPPIPCGKEKLGNVKLTNYVICTGFFLKRDEDERGKERERERERQRDRERQRETEKKERQRERGEREKNYLKLVDGALEKVVDLHVHGVRRVDRNLDPVG